MPDSECSPIASSLGRGKDYPINEQTAITSLHDFLHGEIGERGALAFSKIMEHALYHPELGYYARGESCVGRAGDFFTSVSVGPAFGQILARRFLLEWCSLGNPRRWTIHEYGAHDGSLAHDVLDALRQISAEAYQALIYQIHEPLPTLKLLQREKLMMHQTLVSWPDASSQIEPLPGVIFGNELLDALPFERIEWCDGNWHLCRVGLDAAGEFAWQLGEPLIADGDWEILAKLGCDFPHGYRTEVRHGLDSQFSNMLRWLSAGTMLWLDYGFARPEYYHADRTDGTLRTFQKHQGGENPLDLLGGCDITAHVDFTAVAESALRLGCVLADFRSQGAWLTHHGREWLLAHDGHEHGKWSRQFQTLTHPAQMGSKFHVIECSWHHPRPAISDPKILERLALSACSTGSSH